MDELKELLREKLKQVLDLSYRISRQEGDPSSMNKELFLEVVDGIVELNMRRQILFEDYGIDLDGYEVEYFKIILKLLSMIFTEEQKTIILTYVESKNSEKEDPDTPVQIQVTTKSDSFTHTFESAEDVWEIIKKLEN